MPIVKFFFMGSCLAETARNDFFSVWGLVPMEKSSINPMRCRRYTVVRVIKIRIIIIYTLMQNKTVAIESWVGYREAVNYGDR